MTQQVTHIAGPGDRLSLRADEVMALLALAPRSETTAWTAQDLRQWVEVTQAVEPAEITTALTLASVWGAGPTDVVPAAAHIVLTRLSPRVRGEDAARVRRNIESVCAHLHDHVGRAVARHLPRLEPEPGTVSGSEIWAFFFASMSFLLLVVVLTR